MRIFAESWFIYSCFLILRKTLQGCFAVMLTILGAFSLFLKFSPYLKSKKYRFFSCFQKKIRTRYGQKIKNAKKRCMFLIKSTDIISKIEKKSVQHTSQTNMILVTKEKRRVIREIAAIKQTSGVRIIEISTST